MRQQKCGGVRAKDMPSRREPEVSEPVVVAQQVLVLGFDECQGSMNCEQPYSLPNKRNKSNFSQATTASSTRTPARMAVPTGIMWWCLRLSATRGPLLHVNIMHSGWLCLSYTPQHLLLAKPCCFTTREAKSRKSPMAHFQGHPSPELAAIRPTVT